MCRFFFKNYYFLTSYITAIIHITAIIQTVRFPKTCQCRAGCSSAAEHHSRYQAQGPSSSTAGTSRSQKQSLFLCEHYQETQAAKLSSLLGSTHSCCLQTPAQAVLWGVQEKKCHISSKDSAHSPPHQSLHRDVLPPVTLQTTCFTCNCTWLYIFKFF